MIYGDNVIAQQINFQCNQQTQQVVTVIHEKKSWKN